MFRVFEMVLHDGHVFQDDELKPQKLYHENPMDGETKKEREEEDY